MFRSYISGIKGRIFLFFAFCILSTAVCLASAHAVTTNFNTKQKPRKIKIGKARKSLRVGEKFIYSVRWMGINVGEASLEVKELVDFNGREAYHVVATAKSNDFLAKFYNVEDIIHSYIDKKDLCSLKFKKYQREGTYSAEESVVFDQKRHKGYYESLSNGTKKEFDIPDKVHDLLSVFYYFRTLDVKPDSKMTFDVNADEKNWKVVLNISAPQQLEILRKGVHEVFYVVPKAPFKGVIAKRSKAWVYFSVDEDRVPVLIKFRIPFGFVSGVLERMEYKDGKG